MEAKCDENSPSCVAVGIRVYTNRPKEGSVAPVAVELALRGGQSQDTASDRSLAGLADRQHGQAILVQCKTSFSTTSVTLLYTSQLLTQVCILAWVRHTSAVRD